MAVDTEDRRRSVAGIPMVPDGTIASPDLQHIAGVYSGITVAAPEDEGSPCNMMMMGVSG